MNDLTKEAQEIVGQLTAAQKRAMLIYDEQSVDQLASLNVRLATSLRRLGLTYVQLSPIGSEVRDIVRRDSQL